MSPKSTSSRALRGVALQRRDLDVLEALVLLRAETLDELHAQFFAGRSRKRAINRLAQLVGAGYLHAVDVELHREDRSTRVYTLGPKARAALELRSLSSEHFRFRRWNPTLRDSSIPHQIVVNRLGRALDLRWMPEHLLPVVDKNGARNRPDAVAEGVGENGERRLIGFEVDLGHYSRERIVAKRTAWRALRDTSVLVFVVPDETRKAQVKRWLGHGDDVRVMTPQELVEFAQTCRERFDSPMFDADVWENGAIWERRRARWADADRQDRGDV